MVVAVLVAIVKGLIAWLVLMLVGTNLLGFAYGGLASPIHAQHSDHPGLAQEVTKGRATAYVGGAVSLAVLVSVLFALWRFNPGVAVAAAMLMLARLPDLQQEMQTGERTTAENQRRGGIYTVAAALNWLALVVVVVAFYLG